MKRNAAGGSGADAALGARVHSGWTVLVAVAGSDRPEVIERRRVVIADRSIAGSKQPFHAAEGWPLAKAETYLNKCQERTHALAREGLSQLVADLRTRGHALAVCAVLTATERPLPALDRILASHALIHAAEGALYRDAVADAAAHCGLTVMRIAERELDARAAAELRTTPARLHEWLAEMRRILGPPWTQDEKRAALAARVALAARRRRAAAAR